MVRGVQRHRLYIKMAACCLHFVQTKLLCIIKLFHNEARFLRNTPSRWPPSHLLLLSYCFLHGKYSRLERECRRGDCMLALKETPFQQWLAEGLVFWPCRSLHIIDLAFVLPDLTPAAHNVQYIKRRHIQTVYEASLHRRPGPLSEQRRPSGWSCDLCLGLL